MTNSQFLMPDPECYIYLHHVKNSSGGYGVVILLPTYAESLNDSIAVSFQSTTPLSRSAPIYSYENSGPRSLQAHFKLHRDMMYELNYSNSNLINYLNANSVEGVKYTKDNALDYVDIMAREIQAAALPSYNATQKMVNPPLVSLKLGKEIFITGVVSGSVGVSYGLPIIKSPTKTSGYGSVGKYSQVEIDFTLVEVIPYTADSIVQTGSFRGSGVADLFSRSKYTYGSSASASQVGGSITHGALAGNTY